MIRRASQRDNRELPLALLALLTLGISACEKSESDVIDTATAIPYQTTASIFPDTVDTDTINVGPQRLPEDILPITISAERISAAQVRTPQRSVSTCFPPQAQA